MAVDTATKRASVLYLSFALALPVPDSTIDVGDRQHLARIYGGALLAFVAPDPPSNRTLLIKLEDRTFKVQFDSRTYEVKLEDRTHRVQLEDRTYEVPLEDRTYRIV